MRDDEVWVVLCTAPNDEVAERLARGIVEARLAACVNILPGIRSVYRWKGEIAVDAEVQLVIKTTRWRFDALASHLRAEHPYELPEIVALRAEDGNPAYLEWVARETTAS